MTDVIINQCVPYKSKTLAGAERYRSYISTNTFRPLWMVDVCDESDKILAQ